jgi:hypothetical protein
MKRTTRDFAIIAIAMVGLLFVVLQARSEPQTRIYGSDGRSIGTATPQSDGSVRYRDAGGNSIGTSTTTPSGSAGSTTTFYGPGGSVTGKTVGPAGNGPFGSGARR